MTPLLLRPEELLPALVLVAGVDVPPVELLAAALEVVLPPVVLSVVVEVPPELDPEDEPWQTPSTQNQPVGQGASSHVFPVGSMNGVEVRHPPARARAIRKASRVAFKSSPQLPPAWP